MMAGFWVGVCWVWGYRGAQLGGRGRLGGCGVGCFNVEMPVPPKGFGGHGACCVCSAVSYFSTRVGSIIGAGRLSFRVRDGSGRFPVAVAAVTLFKFVLVVGCSGLRCWIVVACV